MFDTETDLFSIFRMPKHRITGSDSFAQDVGVPEDYLRLEDC